MVIKRKDFQKAAAFIHEFLLKLNEDVEGAELRDTLNLALLHMQKYYRSLQNKSQEKNAQSTLPLSARGLSPMTPFFDAPDKFQWKWLNLDSAKIPATFSVEESVNLTTLPSFIQAARSGDVETVAETIQNDPSVTYEQDGIGRTSVTYAVHFDHLNTLHCLLEGKADVNMTAHDASTPLHVACHDGNELALDLLLRYGADMSIQDTQGRAPIHWAVTTKNYECLRILINNHADVNVRDIDGLTPCMWACRMDHIRHFELLCQADTFRVDEPDGIERDEQGRTWMHWAVRRTKPLECLQTLLTRETAAIKDKEGKTVLLLAAEMGSLHSCKLILEIAGTQCINDCDNVNRTALHLASMGGHGDILNFLLENGADLEATDQFNATAWDYARNRQLHYCQLIIMSHQRLRYQSNPTTPIFNGFALNSSQLMNGDIGREYDSYSQGSRSRASSLPITPPHPPKKPRTSKLLGRRTHSLTSPIHSQEFDNRETSSADGPRRKERIEVSVAPRRGPPLRNYRTEEVDMATDENEEDEDVEGVSVGGMDVSDIDDGGDDEDDVNVRRDTQNGNVPPSPRPAPRQSGGTRGPPQPRPRYRPNPPSYTQPLEPRYSQEDYSDVPNHWDNPPQSPVRRSHPPQRYRTQSDPLRSPASYPHPPSIGGQRQHSHQSPPHKHQPSPPQPPPAQYQPHPPRPGSGDSDRPNSGPKQREQALSPNQSSQGSDPSVSKPVEKPGSGSTHRHSPPGILEGRKIPPPLLTPLHNAPRLPGADAFEEVDKKKKKKKKKQTREKELESLSPPPPPQHPSEIPAPRGFAMNLQPPPSARPRAQSGVPAPRFSKSEPQKHDQRHSMHDEMYTEEESIKDAPMMNGHAIPVQDREQEDPSSKSQAMDSEDMDDEAMENTTEENLGPLIPPPHGFQGSHRGQRPLSQSYPKDSKSAALQMKPTSAKPPIMPRSRSMGRSSSGYLRSSGGKSASPGRRHRSSSNS